MEHRTILALSDGAFLTRRINMKEVWKPVKNYEGIYEVSNYGNVRSVDRHIPHREGVADFFKGKMLKPYKRKRGYLTVCLYKDFKPCSKYVHRLVAEAFIENKEMLPIVNHIDENPGNNCVTNLEWCTQKHNVNHGTAKERSRETKRKKPHSIYINGEELKIHIHG